MNLKLYYIYYITKMESLLDGIKSLQEDLHEEEIDEGFLESCSVIANLYSDSNNSNNCNNCGDLTVIENSKKVCYSCGFMEAYQEVATGKLYTRQIVVMGNTSLQRNMYKSASINNHEKENEKYKICAEINRLCSQYENDCFIRSGKHIKPIKVPRQTIPIAADIYMMIKKEGVRRGNNKMNDLASCFYCSCLTQNFTIGVK